MSENASSDPQVFQCPTCGASLPVPQAASVRCQYCGSNVLVPPEFLPAKHRRQKAAREATPKETSPTLFKALGGKPWSSQRMTGSVVLAIIVFIAISIFALNANPFGKSSTNHTVNEEINATATWMVGKFLVALSTETATAVPPIKVLMNFGGEGSGAGKFDDPRYIALDPDNNIFIADYADGRVQKFDPSGVFILSFNVAPDQNQNTIIRDMVTNYQGDLFITRGGDVLVYNTQNGKLLRTIRGNFPDTIFEKLAIDAANNISAISEGAGWADLIKLDPDGKQIWMKQKFLDGVVKNNTPVNISSLSIDGLGNTFILNGFNNEIYKFDNQGSFEDRFGSKGDSAQQLSNVEAMAVDGQSRIFLVDSENGYTIKVFDSGGTFLGELRWPDEISAPREMVFDLQGNLYTVTKQAQIARMRLDLGNLGK